MMEQDRCLMELQEAIDRVKSIQTEIAQLYVERDDLVLDLYKRGELDQTEMNALMKSSKAQQESWNKEVDESPIKELVQ